MIIALDCPSSIWSKFETWVRVLNMECLHFGLLGNQWFSVRFPSRNCRSSRPKGAGERSRGREEVLAWVLVTYGPALFRNDWPLDLGTAA